MIDGKNFFDQPVKNNKVTYENIRKGSAGQGDDYTTGWLLYYTYFENYYKMVAVAKETVFEFSQGAVKVL